LYVRKRIVGKTTLAWRTEITLAKVDRVHIACLKQLAELCLGISTVVLETGFTRHIIMKGHFRFIDNFSHDKASFLLYAKGGKPLFMKK